MSDNIAYRGSRFTIEFAKLKDGTIPGLEFMPAEEPRWQARLNYLFQRLGDTGVINNREQFKKVGGHFWEFKSFQIRMLCYYGPDRRVVITHGFRKKGDKIRRSELVRGENIRAEYERILTEAKKGSA